MKGGNVTLDMGHGTYDMGAGQERDIYLFFSFIIILWEPRDGICYKSYYFGLGEKRTATGKCARGG